MVFYLMDVVEYVFLEGLWLCVLEVSSFEFEMIFLKKYMLEDVSYYSSLVDCWLVIWGKVYDVIRWYEFM